MSGITPTIHNTFTEERLRDLMHGAHGDLRNVCEFALILMERMEEASCSCEEALSSIESLEGDIRHAMKKLNS